MFRVEVNLQNLCNKIARQRSAVEVLAMVVAGSVNFLMRREDSIKGEGVVLYSVLAR